MAASSPTTLVPTDPFALVGVRLDGKYDVHSVVAEGGFGVVYRGTHRTLQKPIAIKVLKTPPSLPDASRKAFIDKFVFEARTIARLEHPGIVRILDFGGGLLPAGGAAPWIVLEWIDGHTLDDALAARRHHGGQSPADALALLRPVFDALAVAHDEGVAHRDLKPANIMLARTRQGIEPKLLDFGIAKSMSDDESAPSGATATRTELRAYTPAYAASEQIGSTRTGPWTDVHALALLLTEVLTDQAPIRGDDSTALTVDALSPLRPTPAKFGLDVGPWEPILARALALRPAERFQHAREFLQALDATSPVSATWRPSARWSSHATGPDPSAVTTPRASAPFAPVAVASQPSSPAPSSSHAWITLVALALVSLASVIFLLQSRSTHAPSQATAPAPALPAPPPTYAAAPPPALPTPVLPTPVALADASTPPTPQRTIPARPTRPTTRPAAPLRPALREHVPVE
nr:serine/threonine protein kinase [Deltaproteobacteria bacterium]